MSATDRRVVTFLTHHLNDGHPNGLGGISPTRNHLNVGSISNLKLGFGGSGGDLAPACIVDTDEPEAKGIERVCV
ncbi:uncharacterized protein Nmlp_2709 [Natronomonas moolapensis 8.8.11]|uniref:Uncharacterized protein n=1 Tax=Natronomonas moolapensis (strain DSM 18674 / CECT 7526 / JCM 14361 / 8.8.11) TaxID=268739 RepID=M1XRL6_NATM8|nr:hypothetical protein [Natronomonas moolapensis]CCQ36863.1 uncharacterized protein Nmlp_2709 [Natronomonas moolapensis 8.8.11]